MSSVFTPDLAVLNAVAAATKSDPFMRDRVLTHHANGVKSIDDYAAEYLTGEKKVK